MTTPVHDDISRVNDELSVGADMRFQQRWWRFEKVVWVLFLLVILADLSGLLGRGPLAHAERFSPGGLMRVEYEKIERMNAPSILTVHFAPGAVQEGKVRLWVSQALVQSLGAQRIIPQPSRSELSGDGLLYEFPVSGTPGSAQFALLPVAPGLYPLRLVAGTGDAVTMRVLVLP